MSRSEKNGFCVVADGRVHVELVKSNIVSCATEEIWDVQFASSIGKAHVPEALLHLSNLCFRPFYKQFELFFMNSTEGSFFHPMKWAVSLSWLVLRRTHYNYLPLVKNALTLS